MTKSKSPERLVFFTDAVVAIAMTLLILPLTEVVPEMAAEHSTAFDVIRENQPKIYSFLLSFIVIARLWLVHHRLFEQVKAYNTRLMELNLGWLLTIAILPFPTEMIGAFPSERFTKGLYIGTMLASSILQAAMVLTIRGNENLSVSPNSITDRWRADAIGTPVALAIALVVATVFPDVGYYAIVLVALVPQLARLRYGSRE
jgi:uncharacterized membrane protein